MTVTSISGPLGKRRTIGKYAAIIAATGILALGSAGVNGQAPSGGPLDSSGFLDSGPTGEASVTISQALVVLGGSTGGASEGPVYTNDEGTSFKVGAQVHPGEKFTISLSLGNKTQQPFDSMITVSGPEDILVEVEGKDGASGVMLLTPGSWAFRLDAGESDAEPDVVITAAVRSTARPTKHELQFAIEPLTFSE